MTVARNSNQDGKIAEAYRELEKITGAEYISDKDFMKAAYSRNVDPAFPDRWADIIVRPGSTEEVSGIVKIANKYKISMVPRGGGADLVGGSTTKGGILIDLTRMNHILEIDEKNFYCVVECGVTWGALVSELFSKGLTTGIIGPGSGFSATIGGGLSNSTAGFGSTKYGLVTEICLGVEAVLPGNGAVIRTGSGGNKYAKPFCRYGVSPDFTGLFMGDAGTMGIKTKAALKLFPNPPIKIQRNYALLKDDYDTMAELMYKLQREVSDGIQDLYIVPRVVVQLSESMAEIKPPKRPKVKGPVFMFILEAFDQRIMDVHLEMIDRIMKDDARPFEWQEIDMAAELSKDWKLNLKFPYSYFNKFVSLIPSKISCTTCHKVPITTIKDKAALSAQFDSTNQNNFPEGGAAIFARSIHMLPNGHCVIAGGFNSTNVDEQRKIAMEMWHKKVKFQARYGGVHYWLGESISQSIVESGAYTPEFAAFFKSVKKSVDPNFLLSPNKFHMYSYDDPIEKHAKENE